MVFYNRLLLKIESSEYRGTGKCTEMYHAKEILWYIGVPVFLHTLICDDAISLTSLVSSSEFNCLQIYLLLRSADNK